MTRNSQFLPALLAATGWLKLKVWYCDTGLLTTFLINSGLIKLNTLNDRPLPPHCGHSRFAKAVIRLRLPVAKLARRHTTIE
jgi:hypothetical protein